MDYLAKGWIVGRHIEYVKKPDYHYLKGDLKRLISLSRWIIKCKAESSHRKLQERFQDMVVTLADKFRFFTKYYEIKGEPKNTKDKRFFV